MGMVHGELASLHGETLRAQHLTRPTRRDCAPTANDDAETKRKRDKDMKNTWQGLAFAMGRKYADA